MIRAGVLALVLLTPAALWAQQTGDGTIEVTPLDEGFSLTPELDLGGVNEDGSFGEVEVEVEEPQAAAAEGAVLRGLDRISGALTDLEMLAGETQRFGRLDVTLGECRYPAGNPSGDAYAYLVIRPEGETRPVFEGWMVASSPALNAMDHARYDVWVLRCSTS